jgi:DNA-binding NtrC family response regulator
MCGPLVRRSDKPWSEEENAHPLDQTTSGKLPASNPQEVGALRLRSWRVYRGPVKQAGCIEAADGGTLFLDEVGELPLDAQVKLLRVLQEGELPKVGASSPIRVDIRVVAATHRNFSAMIEEGTFPEDLYYRLAVVPLQIPALRELREDIPELIAALFKRAKDRHHLPNARLSPGVLQRLMSYRWPGMYGNWRTCWSDF